MKITAFALALTLVLPSPFASAQCAEGIVTASTPTEFSRFGATVAADGDWVAIAAPEQGQGAVHLYERVTGQLQLRQVLSPAGITPWAEFGEALAMDGGRLVVGAPFSGQPGKVYVYELAGGSWTLDESFRPAGVSQAVQFGHAVAIEGDLLLAGSRLGGRAWTFRDVGGTWVEEQEFSDPPSWGNSRFGHEVDIDGDRIVIAAPYANIGAEFAAGASRVYEFVGSGWVHVADLVTDDAGTYDEVGRGGIALSGDTVVAAGWLASSYNGGTFCCSPGFVYVFREQGGVWSQTHKLQADDAVDEAFFGRSVDLVGDTLLVGAVDDQQLGIGAGAAYVFDRVGGAWTQRAKLLSPVGFVGDDVGSAVALRGQHAVVGAQWSSLAVYLAGAAVDFDLQQLPDVLATPSCFGEACPCGNDNVWQGCNHSLGMGGELKACGSASVAADDLRLTAQVLVPGQFGGVFMGGGTGSVFLGDGRLCVGPGAGGLWRFPLQSTGGGSFELDGLVSFAAGNFGTGGAILAGSTWHFQAWFRDPAPPPCDVPVGYDFNTFSWWTRPGQVPKGYNLTNMLSVTFRP